MAWKRFPVAAFDYRPLKGRVYKQPAPIPSDKAQEIIERARAGDAEALGGHVVEPDAALLSSIDFQGDYRDMVMCVLPSEGTHLAARSYAWFNQRAFVLDGNKPDAEVLFNWRTPRPMNTLLGPEDGVPLDQSPVYLLSGRIVSDYTRGNKIMIDDSWFPPDGRAGFRVIAACNEGKDDFHESCFEFSWPA